MSIRGGAGFDRSKELYVGGDFEATGTITFNGVTYTWPSADGTNGQTLVTDGAGTLSFSAAGSGDLKADGSVPLTADWDAGNSLYDITAVEFKGALIGNANTATALATARDIGGTSFDGTGNIDIANLIVQDTTDATSFVAMFESATGTNLEPKTDAGLTYDASTGDLSSTKFGGITEANLLDKSAGETISGDYTFTGTTTLPQGSGTSPFIGEGAIYWEDDTDSLFMGTGGAPPVFIAGAEKNLNFVLTNIADLSDQASFPCWTNHTSYDYVIFEIQNLSDTDNVSYDLDECNYRDFTTARNTIADVTIDEDGTGCFFEGTTGLSHTIEPTHHIVFDADTDAGYIKFTIKGKYIP